jgi:aminobenzoyl-glutamate utilization protein A
MRPQIDGEWLREVRRDLHRHPEPAWREFYTTARIVAELERIGVDEIHLGPEVLASEERLAVPDAAELATWRERAREAGADEAVLDTFEGGHTGAIAVLERGEGPTVALRVDIDALEREESESETHRPAREGFRAETPAMHACGHDAHATIGLGVLRAVIESDFAGTLKVIFQPAEESIGGGKAVAAGGHLDDVDYLLAVHVGFGYPTGEFVAGMGDMLAVRQFRADFAGDPAHAGIEPEAGADAVQAMATAVQNLHGIARHGDGATRVNAGHVGGGSATNIVPETAFLEGEVRGETTRLMEYAHGRATTVLDAAAAMHDCAVEREITAEAPSAESDPDLVAVVHDAAKSVGGVERAREHGSLGGSEDATYLMRRVQERGGLAAYVCVGTDHPGGHHTATFDVDEETLDVGVAALTRAVLAVGDERP